MEDLGLSSTLEEYIESTEPAVREFSPARIRPILEDPKVFPQSADLIEFTEKITGGELDRSKQRDQIVDDIVKSLKESPTIKQQLFIQALEQRLKKDEIAFQKYFESWERNIKG